MIGPSADEAEVLSGNYNGTPVAPVTVLAGIRAAAGPGTKVTFARGGPLATGLPDLHVVPGSALSTGPAADRRQGLSGAYYGGHFDDAPVLERVDAAIDFDWADRSPSPLLGDDSFSVRWTGAITAPATGRTTLGVRCATACRLFVDGKPVAQGRSDHEPDHDHGCLTLRGRAVPTPSASSSSTRSTTRSPSSCGRRPAGGATRWRRRWRPRRPQMRW